MDTVLAASVCMILSAILVLVFDWLWPRASSIRLEIVSSLFVPVVLSVMIMMMLVSETRHLAGPAGTDRGIVSASLVAAGPLIVLLSLALCFTAASLTLRLRRRMRGR